MQGLWSLQSAVVVQQFSAHCPTQKPEEQVSPVIHGLGALHAVPSWTGGLAQKPPLH